MTISEIKQYMKENKITYEKLSAMTGLSLSTVTKIFAGYAKYPRVDTMQAIERALGLDHKYGAAFWQNAGIEPLPNFYEVPLIGTIACGTPTLATENIEEYIKVDQRIKADFALRCKGDSMINARIFDGDIVYIRQQHDIENGEIAAVLVENEATLKRVYKYENRIELRPENPTFAPLNYEGAQMQQIRILGKAVAFLSTLR